MKSLTIVIFNLDFGGSEQVIVNLANKLSENYSVKILTINNIISPFFTLNESIQVISLNKNSFFGGLPALAKYTFSSKDQFFISNDMPINLICCLSLRIFFKGKTKCILIEHSMPPIQNSILKVFARWIYSSADEIISVAESIQDSLKKEFNIKKEVKVISNPIFSKTYNNIDLTIPQDKKNIIAQWQSSEAIKILNVANLKPIKDHKTLIHAVKILISRGINISLLIIGGGILESELKVLIRKLDLESNIFLLGKYPATDEIFLMSELFVLSSISEGFSLALCQAAQNNLKIVSTTGAKTVELLGKNYPYIAKVSDAADLANKIHAGIHNPKTEINQRAIENWDESIFYKKYLDLLN